MAATIWIDGEYRSPPNATVSVYDHGFLYGDGVFEGIRIYGGRAFRLAEHMTRLYESAHYLMLTIGYPRAELEAIVQDAIARSARRSGYIRLIVTRGVGTLGLDPAKCPKASVVLIVDDIQLYPQELYETGIPVITASTRRIPRECFDARIKSMNYLNNILAKLEARRANVLEAILLNTEGLVAECTADNVFFLKDGVLKTPRALDGALSGITRQVVIELAEKLELPFVETSVALFDLYTADECFMTGSGAEIMPIVSVDGRTIADGKPGAWTRSLIAAFRKQAEGGF